MSEQKDWTGNGNSIYKTLGASNHTDKEREKDDFYATDPIAINRLLKKYHLPKNVWECSCGQGHLSERLIENGYNVFSSDLVDRGYDKFHEMDFLKTSYIPFDTLDDVCILTNPPYKLHTEFILHALDILPEGAPVILLLKTTALEGKKRFDLLYNKGYLKYIYQFTERLLCAKNADFEGMRAGGGSAVSYAWFVFQKGNCDKTTIDWI